VVTLEGGSILTGLYASAASRLCSRRQGARRHSDHLIDRRCSFFHPGRRKQEQGLNYLLPHIRRMPNRIVRDEFASDAAQKLGIDSALVREETAAGGAQARDEVTRPLWTPGTRLRG